MLSVRIAHKNGLHMRVAAKAIHLLSQYMEKDSLDKVFIHVGQHQVPLSNLLQVSALNIRCGETVGISCDGPYQGLLRRLGEYLGQNRVEENEMDSIDELVEQMVITDFGRLVSELDTVRTLKEQYDLVLRTVGDAISLLDAEGIIQYVNPAFEQLYAVSPTEIIGRHVRGMTEHDLYARVYASHQPLRGQIIRYKNTLDIVLDIIPVVFGGSLHAVVCVSRSLSQVEELLKRVRTLEQEKQDLQQRLIRQQSHESPFTHLVGQSVVLVDSLSMASKAAKTQSTILITGESGTGKELMAKAIHHASARREGPFVRVNCAGIPVNLIESELFGHERGAFTGAVAIRKGKFELAQNGTIFLDEIGELPVQVQAKLLRVLQEREVERVGSDGPIPLNVRVIAATNRDLEEEVRQRNFREDLYYRVNVVRIHMPPLRDRMGDIYRLVEHFIDTLRPVVNREIKGCTQEVLAAFGMYHWPGNVRELRNVIERAMNLCDGPWITLDELPGYIRFPAQTDESREHDRCPTNILFDDEPLQPMEEYEKRIIHRALALHRSYNAAAKALGLTHKTVARKARQYGLVKMHNYSGQNS